MVVLNVSLPTEQASGVCRGDLGDLFAGCHVDFCNFISNMRHKGRFVAFAAMRDRGQEGRVGFDQEPVKRQLADDLTLFFRVFIGDRSGDADDRNSAPMRFLRGFEIPIEGMKTPGFSYRG